MPRAVVAIVALFALSLTGCKSGDINVYDPTVYVDGQYCPDQNGHAGPEYPWTRQRADSVCCADQGIPGGGQCPEGTSCMNTDTCSSPLPDPSEPMLFSARLTRRTGMQ